MDKKKILVIEDDPPIARILKYNFEKQGYLITVVKEAEKALETLAQQKYDLIIHDMKLPLLEYGLELFSQIRNRYKEIPIVILSVAADESPVIDLDAAAFILKPFELKNLNARIKKIVNSEEL
ncbi:MAG: response regulator [bacterium]